MESEILFIKKNSDRRAPAAYHMRRSELSINAGIGRSSLDKFQRRPANKIPGIEPTHQGSSDYGEKLAEKRMKSFRNLGVFGNRNGGLSLSMCMKLNELSEASSRLD